jgi:RNA recognition motif-containing protein
VPATDPNNLYFSGLPLTVTAQHLCDLVRPFGEPVSGRILVNSGGYSRGIGFVRMVNPEHCLAVIKTLNGLRLPGLLRGYLLSVMWLSLNHIWHLTPVRHDHADYMPPCRQQREPPAQVHPACSAGLQQR